MNLVEFFGTVIKPKKVKGKGMMSPLETGSINDHLFFIRDKDVNAFLIKTNKGYIAIDTGYKNSENMKLGLEKLNIDPALVHTVLLTHLDLDHAGGLDKRCHIIYPNAKLWLGKKEAKYLTKEYARKKILGIKLASPIKLNDGFNLLNDMQEIISDNVKITAILSPGHTLGHMAYLIENYLFMGDTLILGVDSGYCFWDFWNTDSELNKQSLDKLYQIAKNNNVKYIITSHNGMTQDVEKAFLNRNTYLNWKKRGFVFRNDAPFDPYH